MIALAQQFCFGSIPRAALGRTAARNTLEPASG
jgi:hypothetical protein